ncbi:RNA dependent RNA polymerase-domain-containing protein [Mycena epipterygia]|nr:RNA dependent RNA polymerase-domain-containing protein [Mycena epipterygia]
MSSQIQESSVNPKSEPDAASWTPATLLGGCHGSELEAHVIAHCTEVQTRFDSVGVQFGVQWELTRGVSTGKWTWQDVEARMKAKYDIFKGSNAQIAGKVPAIMRGRPEAEPRDLALWSVNEADREYETLREGNSGGLGRWDGQTNYYGGQIQYLLRLVKADDASKERYRIYLEKPQKGRSHRFARDLGSSSVLQLSIPSQLVKDEGDEIRLFLAKRFVINGRVYMPIPPKDDSSVYLIQTNQDWHRKPLAWYGDQYRMSFDDFIQRHNPPELNSQQPFAKYTARYALGLSTSTPVLEFDKENIFYIQDTLAHGWDPSSTEKPPAEKIMTDGCGFINRSALLLITKRIGYASLPTAVQGRIGGAKGLWTLHPTDEDMNPKIWIRDSQLKISLHDDHRVHRIFDLLRASHPSQTDERYELSEQSILCLSANGIPDKILVDLLVDGLEQTVKPLLDWTGAMTSLWRAINAAGNVSGSRMQRIAGSKSRVLGFRDRDSDKLSGETDTGVVDTDDLATSSRSGRDKGPLSLHEQAVELIQAGFHPMTCAYLNDKMRYIIKTEINSVVDKYRISLPESTASDAFVIPDPVGILKENEIYYRSSNPMKNPITQTLFQILVGPVIVGFTSYPIRLPCDMQMVTAVDVPELYNWPDVIIASTAGKQSLLSLLSGGGKFNYTVIFLWLEAFLNNFRNQPFTPPPPDFMNYFEREVKTVNEVGNELRCKSPKDSQRAFQEYLLAGLRQTQVGLYSYFHDNAIWRHGYSHPNSILMAYIGNTLLDAGKTGLRLKNDVFEKHQRDFGHKRPKTNNWSGSVAGQAKGDELLREHDLASGKLADGGGFKKFEKDADLLGPYKCAQQKSLLAAEWSALYKSELQAIERHIDKVRTKYNQYWPIPSDRKAERAAASLAMHTKFAEAIPTIQLMDASLVEQVKASYAYHLKDDFGFAVAFKTLCSIKAGATSGGIAPTCRVFDELKTITGAASRATQDVDEDM